MEKYDRRYFAVAGLAAALAMLVFDSLRMPFIWLPLMFAGLAFLGACGPTRPVIKTLSFYTGLIAFVFACFEASLWLTNERARHLRYDNDYGLTLKPPLGYVPPANTLLPDAAYWKHERIYNVSYTLDAHGLRSLSRSEAPPAERGPAVLFFGGSMIFGQGVEDQETLTSQVAHLSGEKFTPYNFGFIGYGAHQMLSTLEHRLEARVINSRPTKAIYVAIIDHINRVKGRAFWDRHGPRYVRTQDGVEQDGYFDDHVLTTIKSKLREKSLFLRRALHESISDADLELFVGIVDASRQAFERRYPGSEFHVILWDRHEWGWRELADDIQERLLNADLRLHSIRDMIPDFDKRIRKYTLHQHEGHPSPLAHRLMAQYVVGQILEK